MSKESIYKCDCCKKEISSADDLIEVVLPYQIARDTTGSLISWKMVDEYRASKEFDICQDCAKSIVKGYRTQNIKLSNNPYENWIFERGDNNE